MKVAFINSLYAPYATGGAEATLQGLAEGLARQGDDVHVICLTPEPRAHTSVLRGVNVHYEPCPNVMWPWRRDAPPWRKALFQLVEASNPVARRRVTQRLRAIAPDVVHVHNFKGFSASVWGAAATLGVPVVQTLHDYTLVCPRSVMFKDGANCTRQCASCRLLTTPRRMTSAIPHAYTAVSHRMLARMADCDAFPAGLRPVVIRGDNPDVPTPHDRIAPPGTRSPVFGFLGRLESIKGVEVLIAAAQDPALGAPSVLIAGAGAPDYEASLRDQARSAADIVFLGHTPAGEVFARVDVLIVPSIWEEPLGRVIHEAFAYGRPVIASRIGGMPEIVRDGVSGLLFDAGDARALAAAMKRLSEPGLLQVLREGAAAAAADFDRTLIYGQYARVLHEAAREQAHGARGSGRGVRGPRFAAKARVA